MAWAIACSCAVARVAFAQDALHWSFSAPAACPGGDWVLGRVARYLARPVRAGDDASLSVAVVIAAGAAGEWNAQLSLESPAGRRERALHDVDCVLVADAVAFIVAHAIDPAVQPDAAPLTADERARGSKGGGASGAPSAEAEPPPSPAADGAAQTDGPVGTRPGGSEAADSPAAEPEPAVPAATTAHHELIQLPPEPTPEPAPGPPLRVRWAFGAEGALAWQPLPVLAPGVLLHGAMRLGAVLRIELALGYFPAHAQALPDDPEVAAHFDFAQAALRGCALATAGGSQLGLCLGAHVGLVRGRGDELSSGRDDTLPYVALALGPVVMQRLSGPLALRFELAPTLALARPRFELDDGSLIYAAESFGFVAALGAELRFD